MKQKFLMILILLVSLLSIASLIIVITDQFSVTTARVLESFIVVGIFSLLGLCAFACSKRYSFVAAIGAIICTISAVASLALVWNLIKADYNNLDFYLFITKSIYKLYIGSIAFAHIGLLLSIDSNESGVDMLKVGTALVTFFFYVIIAFGTSSYTNISITDKLPAILGILSLCGTVITLALNKMSEDDYVSPTSYKSVSSTPVQEKPIINPVQPTVNPTQPTVVHVENNNINN